MTQSNANMQSLSRKSRSCCTNFWREGHRQARNDIRARWRTGGLRFLAFVWLTGLCLCLAILSRLSTTTDASSLTRLRLVACQPNGVFDLYPENYRYWSGSGFFQITLGHGKLSFTQAKAIDVIWDIVCARGGQALVALVSWHVFTNYVTTSMEVAPVTFSTYRTIFLQNESLVLAIPRLLRDFTRRRGLHSKVAMAFIIATMIFILIFPSFASAMTGYSGNVKSYIRNTTNPDLDNLDDSNYMAFSSFQRILYVIHDGWRVGLEGDYVIPYNNPYTFNFIDPVLTTNNYFDLLVVDRCDPKRVGRQPSYEQERCRIQTAVADYVSQQGFHGLKKGPSSFLNIDLGPPVLDISAYYLPDDSLGANWTDPRTGQRPFRDKTRNVWTYENVTYDINTINMLRACQPVETYHWGFSFIQLNIMLILCILWTIGILSMWIASHMTMKQRCRTDVAGEYKAVLELANAMNVQLLEAGESSTKEVLSLSESVLHQRFKQDLNGGSIAYEAPLLEGKEHGIGTWVKEEIWWITVILASLAGFFCMCFLLGGLLSWVLAGFSAALVLTVCLGASGKSRAILLMWGILLLCLVPLGISISLIMVSV